jgi:hypothetical protein
MAVTDALWQTIEPHAARLLTVLQQTVPKGPSEIRTHYVFILGMFWRSVRLYHGILVLLKAQLPEEAALLARSLFEESLRLRQLADEPGNRDALVLGWANDSITERVNLFRTAKAMGLDNDIDASLASLEEKRRELDTYRGRRGVGRFLPFLSEKDAAIRYDRKDDYWTYALAHEFVHGSDVAWMYGRQNIAADTVGLFAQTDNPEFRAGIAHFAAASLTEVAVATFSILGWPINPEVQAPFSEIQRVLDEHETGKGKDRGSSPSV